MKISTHHRKKDKVLKESITFSLENSNKFTIEYDNGNIENYSIHFDLENPQTDDKLFNKVFKVKVEDKDIEVIELHCSSENQSFLWSLLTNEGESILIFAEKHYCVKYRHKTENGTETYYANVINVNITQYENEKG